MPRGWTAVLIYVATMCANARSFAFDRELAHRYASAGTPPPDAIRRPVEAGAIARGLGLPYATVRRHAQMMLGTGEFERAGGGYLTAIEWMQRPDVIASAQALAQQLDRVLRQLGGAGFPFADPSGLYRNGRPALLEFPGRTRRRA